MKIRTIGELSKVDPNVLIDAFGSFGKELFLLANGIDASRIEDRYDVLSIGREITLDRYTNEIGRITEALEKLTKETVEEVEKQQMWFKGVSVKVRYADLTKRIKNKSLSNYSDSFDLAYGISQELLKTLVKEKPVRKVGVRVYALECGRDRELSSDLGK